MQKKILIRYLLAALIIVSGYIILASILTDKSSPNSLFYEKAKVWAHLVNGLSLLSFMALGFLKKKKVD